jgi:hypothetical protein
MERRKYIEASTQTYAEGEDGVIEQQAVEEPPKKAKDLSWMLENMKFERIVWTTTTNGIPPSANEVASNDATELLCSYSWKRSSEPTIYVPGTPVTYTPPTFAIVGEKDGVEITEPIQLPEDAGAHWVDQHAARVPLQQFEPIFQAATAMNKDLRFNKVKIVVNRSSLMQLHSFVKGKSPQAFHLELKMIKDTLFIERKVRTPKTVSKEGSYGRSFEHYFTTEDPELEDAEGHHRVLGYTFGGIYIAIRIEADGPSPRFRSTTQHQHRHRTRQPATYESHHRRQTSSPRTNYRTKVERQDQAKRADVVRPHTNMRAWFSYRWSVQEA